MTMRVRKAVFPAAGLGTRFLPVTKAQPKEMLPLVDKPIIQYGVEEALAAGCDQIIMITGRGKQAIEDHFDVSYELEKMLEERKKFDLLQIVRQISDMIHIAYVRQKEALGLGHAVLTARELVGNEAFAVLLADDVIDAKVPCLKQMMQVFEETQCSVIATLMIDGPAISSYGVLKVKPADGRFKGRLYEIVDLVEKPSPEKAPSNLAVIGRYILTPTVFDCLSETQVGIGGELQLTDGLRLLLRKEKMYAYVYQRDFQLPRLLLHAIRQFLFVTAQLLSQRGIRQCQNLCCQNPSVGSARLTDSNSGDGNPRRHLHGREQRIESVQRSGRNRYANNRKTGVCRNHSRKVRRTARARNDHTNSARGRLLRILRRAFRRTMSRSHIDFITDPESLQCGRRLPHDIQIGVAPHDDRNQYLAHEFLSRELNGN